MNRVPMTRTGDEYGVNVVAGQQVAEVGISGEIFVSWPLQIFLYHVTRRNRLNFVLSNQTTEKSFPSQTETNCPHLNPLPGGRGDFISGLQDTQLQRRFYQWSTGYSVAKEEWIIPQQLEIK